MANILLVDPSEVACKAMHGILARGKHRLVTTDSSATALAIIRRNVCVDLVFLELKLAGDGGLTLVRQLKNDRLLRYIPVVFYTDSADRDAVKRAIELRVQNFLIKPYHEEDIFGEIDKALVNPWRARHFEEEKSFCRMTGIAPAQLREQLAKLAADWPLLRPTVEKAQPLRDSVAVTHAIAPLRERAEAAGAWGFVECLNQLAEHVTANTWSALASDLQQLDFASELLCHWVDPKRLCPDFLPVGAQADVNLAAQRKLWLSAPEQNRCPMIAPEQLQKQIVALGGCPVIDTAAAGFQMIANGQPSCINPIMDLVARDPGLTTQMLVAANRMHQAAEEFNRIEDARLAIGQLGELRLQQESRRLVTLESRIFSLEPALSWASYWTYTRAVARIAQMLCRELEFDSFEAAARTIGQLHDLGTLLLARVQPAGFQAIVEYSRVHRVPRATAEKLFLGCTTQQLAAFFAEHYGLSRRFINVLRWLAEPSLSTEDRQLAAIVSLARNLCLQNEVGASGHPQLETTTPLEETVEWTVLREGLYPSFNLGTFEQRVHSYCGQLRAELSGRVAGTVGDLFSANRGL